MCCSHRHRPQTETFAKPRASLDTQLLLYAPLRGAQPAGPQDKSATATRFEDKTIQVTARSNLFLSRIEQKCETDDVL
jgi:hypothetical protein